MAFNIFDILPVYATKWSVSTENPPRPLNAEELKVYTSGKVVNSDFGYAVELTRVDGGVSYIPVVRDKTCGLGDIVDLTKAIIVTLTKPGEKDILRIDF